MVADIHSYYSSEDAVLNLLELGDNLPSSTNPALGHTDANVRSIYSINVASIVGTDHHAYISSKFMDLLMQHWDHRKLFGSENFGPVFSSFCYPGIQQNCTEGKNFLLNIQNGSSICNPAFEKCSSEEITKANINYIQERDNLTSLVQSSLKPAVIAKLSDLLAKTFEGNSTAAKEFVTLTNSLKPK